MKSLKQPYHIKSPISEVWKALTDSSYIDGWGGGPSKMSVEKDASFSFWDGEIWGKNIEVIPNKKLVQEWTEGKWDKPSIVTFNLKEEDGETVLELIHEGYPEGEHDELDKGWKDFYLLPLKDYLERKK